MKLLGQGVPDGWRGRRKVIRAKQSSCQLSTYFVGRWPTSSAGRCARNGRRLRLGRYHEAVLAHGTLPVKFCRLVRDRLKSRGDLPRSPRCIDGLGPCWRSSRSSRPRPLDRAGDGTSKLTIHLPTRRRSYRGSRSTDRIGHQDRVGSTACFRSGGSAHPEGPTTSAGRRRIRMTLPPWATRTPGRAGSSEDRDRVARKAGRQGVPDSTAGTRSSAPPRSTSVTRTTT